MRKFLNLIKEFLNNTLHLNIVTNSINNKNAQINVQGGNFIQANTTYDLSTKESVEEASRQIMTFLQKNYFVDVNNDKFQFYLNQSVWILKLNDSQTKRKVLIELLARKFGGKECLADDSDAPTTIALDAMRYLTDTTLLRLCAFRLLTNVIPSIINDGRISLLPSICDFIEKNGLIDQTEIMNLRRLGIIYSMHSSAYSIDSIRDYIISDKPIANLDISKESLILSSCLSVAGLELTDITLEYFLNLVDSYEYWLPTNNKSLHLKELVVDEDVTVNKNIVAYGTMASGGRARAVD